MDKKKKVQAIIAYFNEEYPDATCSLVFENSLQLLVATQLSAQCTDLRVNMVTKELFKKYQTVYDFANADNQIFEMDIKPTGFFRNKSKNIIGCCKRLIDEFGGEVPGTMEELLTLPGVGRKTANLVLGDVFGISGVVVDTHAKRVSYRLGLTKNLNPDKVEQDLMKIIPNNYQIRFSHQMVWHGRARCMARKPDCTHCRLCDICNFYISAQKNEQ